MSVIARVIPCLLLDRGSLVKTVRFRGKTYIGDPANTIRIFNELEVDELCIFDISATRDQREPDLALLEDLAGEAFMPLCYGGGVRSVETVRRLLRIGFEKVAINSHALSDPFVFRRAADAFGSQALVAAIDVKRSRLRRRYEVVTHGATRRSGRDVRGWAREVVERGAGEILLTSVDREGTWAGYDNDLVAQVAREVSVPVIAHGGAGGLGDIRSAIRTGGAAAVALGSMVVFQQKGHGVLVNFPERSDLDQAVGRAPRPIDGHGAVR